MERVILLLALILSSTLLAGQEADRLLRKGNAEYKRGDLQDAADTYSKVEDERGTFNLGNAYYRQDSANLARRTFENAASMAKEPATQARAFHNLGNSWMKEGNYREAMAAYKEALKRVPADEDTRYNLAYAQQMLKKQEEQQKGQGDDEQKDKQEKQDQQDKQDNQDQQNKDQQDQEQDQGNEDEGDEKQPEQKQEEQQQKPQPDQQQRIDPQDAMRMLDAAQQQEKDVQGKVREMMQPKPAKPAEKDW